MASRAKRFLWNEERKLAFLRILANWKASHEASKCYNWPELISEFKKQTGETVDKGVLQNKLANMRIEYTHWKSLLKSEAGVAVEPSTGSILVDSFWWVRKLKESRDYKKFMSSGVPKVVEDLYSQIFDGSMTTGIRHPSKPGPNANAQPKGFSLPENRQSGHVFGSATPSKKQKRYDPGHEEADDQHEEADDHMSDSDMSEEDSDMSEEDSDMELYLMMCNSIHLMMLMALALIVRKKRMHRK